MDTPKTPKEFIKKNQAKVLLLIFLSLAVYINSLSGSFVSDDIPSIPNNPLLKNPINAFLKSPGFPGNLTYPLLSLNYLIGGTGVGIYHLTNILLHAVATVLAFLLVYYLTCCKKIALFASAIFAVHPLHTEAVSWISGRHYILYSIFLLLSLIFYRLSSYRASLIFYAVSLPIKTFSLTLPFVLVVYEISLGNLAKNWKKLLPFFVVSAIFVLLSLTRIQTHITGVEAESRSASLLNPLIQIPAALTTYGGLFFWPKNLTFYHEDIGLSSTKYFISVLATLALLSGLILSYKKAKTVFFFLSLSILSLLPTLTPLHIAWVVAERYFYLGSLGLCFILALALDKLEETLKIKNISYIIFAILILAFSVRTIIRNFDWRNEDTLWIATVKASPRSSKAHNNMGDYYARHGDLPSALESFETAFRLRPDYADAYHNYGNTLLQIGKLDESIPYFEKALSFNPNIIESYNNLAIVYHKKGDPNLAQQMIEKSLNVNPNSPKTYNLMGGIYFENKEYEKARQAFLKALKLDPTYTPAKQNLLILERQAPPQ